MMRTILVGGVLFVGLSVGWQMRATWSLWGESRSQARTIRVIAAQTAVTAKADANHQSAAAATRTLYRTLYREIPVYVPTKAAANWDVPVGFVRLHDAAAQSVPTVPDPAGRPDAAPSAIGLDSVAVAVVQNYEVCNAVRERLSALQGWIVDQAALD